MKGKQISQRLAKLLVAALAAVMLSACSLPGLSSTNSKTIRIATQSSTESAIMANIVAELISHELDTKTTLVSNLGSSSVTHQALVRGDADIAAARYTGTDLTATLQHAPVKDPATASKIVKREFKRRYDQVWYPTYGFADTYAFMVTKEFAKKYRVKKVSDLKKLAGKINAGVDTVWMNHKGDGYNDFVKAYGFTFKRVSPMQIGLVYDAVEGGKMQVVLGYSTDGRIRSYGLQILQDDKQFFPPYDCSLLVKQSVLDSHPGLKKLLHRLDGKISNSTMQQLNYEVDDELEEPATVAREFLEKHDYFRGSESK